MQSFRTELENPVVQKEIIDLEKKIKYFLDGKIDEQRFRSLRLARGVYGQRQHGVQMVRIKLPFGRLTTKQFLKIADISDEYSTGMLHLTTRQDIQVHFVSLDKTPELWAKLAEDDITLREACGNTVRNVTASPVAGIDPKEPFDVSPYAYEIFMFFIRNPICQELGRKFKIAFSSGDDDTAYTFIHDVGLIPKIKYEGKNELRGFKVVVGGGLGSQPFHAKPAFEFLHEDSLIPFMEGVVRVFDRYGERTNRNRARLKFLINKIGYDEFIKLVEEEHLALKSKSYKIDRNILPDPALPQYSGTQKFEVPDKDEYQNWLKTNVFEQKQKGFFAIRIKVLLGNLSSETVRKLAPVVKTYAADDIRITVNQGLILRFIREDVLPLFYNELKKLGLAEPGFNSTIDITACPGTDTCNLGISDSTSISEELERVVTEEFPDLIFNNDIKIKISGCMNSCGQHGIANIGFHGSSIKHTGKVLPALQLLLGGGSLGNGEGRFSERVIKIPSKRVPNALRILLNDYENNSLEGEYFNSYFDRQGKNYFYQLLKNLTDLSHVQPIEYIDWGDTTGFSTAVGTGECAGVIIDLVATLLYEAEEKISWGLEAFENNSFADSIYHSYSTFIWAAKALLLTKNISPSTQNGIINEFNNHFNNSFFSFEIDFKDIVLKINHNEPTKEFAEKYLTQAKGFLESAKAFRKSEIQQEVKF
ncbi:MAG: HEPN domain-containing protein [Ignavibacteriales bacterium]|nr:MAG: HEPN domain-containing protein [Ignavibacteriales bacterium]